MTQGPKKSETLELRISHEEKSALRDKASHEGRSVSAVVRSLITKHLSDTGSTAKPFSLRSLRMFISSHPKTIILGIAAAISGSLLLPNEAAAENVLIAIESVKVDDQGDILASKRTAFLKDHDHQTCYYLEGGSRTCLLPHIKPDLLVATFDVRQQTEGEWTVAIEVREGETIHSSQTLKLRPQAGDELVIASPDGHDVSIAAVINDDPTLKNPVMPRI